MARRTQQTKVDVAIAALSAEQLDQLAEMGRNHANATDIHRWLNGQGCEVAYHSVLSWYNREHPVGADAAATNALISGYRGLNPADAHTASLACVVKLVGQIMIKLDDTGIENLSPSLLSNLVDLLREQRQSAQMLASTKQLGDRRGLELAGGYRLAEISVNITRDTPNAETVKSVVDAALAKLEEEV